MGQIRFSIDGDPADVADILEKLARMINGGASFSAMPRTVSAAEEMGCTAAAPLSLPPVLGRIDPAPSPLVRLVDSWMAYMQAINRSPGTLKSWRRLVLGVCQAAGWTDPAQITYDALTRHMAAKQASEDWKPATVRSVLSAFKSLDRHAKRLKSGDIQSIDGPIGIEGDDARAATVDEARAMMRTALAIERGDGRARSRRTLYMLCLFTGCREEEPSLWTWGDLHLDDENPWIHWRPEMHKNRRTMFVAIAPELVEQLRLHRATVPHGPGDPVFPVKPPRDVWVKDRDRAGVQSLNERGKKFTPHSARKFCFTSLTCEGIPTVMAEFLIRHREGSRSRYIDPPLGAQAQALQALPRIWPDESTLPPKRRPRTKCGNNAPKRLTSPPLQAEDMGAEVCLCPDPTIHLGPPPSSSPQGISSASAMFAGEGVGPSCFTGVLAGPLLDSVQGFDTVNGRLRTETDSLKNAATARLLRALADLIGG